MSTNVFLTRPYQYPEPLYQVPIPGTYPPRYQAVPVNGTTRATIHPTVSYPQTCSYVYPATTNIPILQTQPQVYYRQPHILIPAYLV